MFCAQCGAADQTSGSYCRRCGEWLADKKSARGAAGPEGRLPVMVTFSAISALLALFSAIALYATYGGTAEANWSVYVAAACCSVIAAHQSINFAFGLQLVLRRRRNRAGWKQQAALPVEPKGLEIKSADAAPAVIVPSVTESTTKIMSAENGGDSARDNS